MGNEDIPYSNINDFATPEKEAVDVDQPNKSVLVEIQQYLTEQIAETSSIKVIDLTRSTKLSVEEQIAVYKLVTNHLENIKSMIDEKVGKLK